MGPTDMHVFREQTKLPATHTTKTRPTHTWKCCPNTETNVTTCVLFCSGWRRHWVSQSRMWVSWVRLWLKVSGSSVSCSPFHNRRAWRSSSSRSFVHNSAMSGRWTRLVSVSSISNIHLQNFFYTLDMGCVCDLDRHVQKHWSICLEEMVFLYY